mgnify:FL=1
MLTVAYTYRGLYSPWPHLPCKVAALSLLWPYLPWLTVACAHRGVYLPCKVAAPLALLEGSRAQMWWRSSVADAAGDFWTGVLRASRLTPGGAGTFSLCYEGDFTVDELVPLRLQPRVHGLRPYVSHAATKASRLQP